MSQSENISNRVYCVVMALIFLGIGGVILSVERHNKLAVAVAVILVVFGVVFFISGIIKDENAARKLSKYGCSEWPMIPIVFGSMLIGKLLAKALKKQ